MNAVELIHDLRQRGAVLAAADPDLRRRAQEIAGTTGQQDDQADS